LLPRRKVDITIERIDRSRLPGLNREKLNPWLEAWYNAGDPEPPRFVRYHFLFGPSSHEYPKPAGMAGADLGKVTPETKTEVAHLLERRLKRPLAESELKPETTLEQFGLDSLDAMALTLDVEQRFGFAGEQVPANVGQLWALAQGMTETG